MTGFATRLSLMKIATMTQPGKCIVDWKNKGLIWKFVEILGQIRNIKESIVAGMIGSTIYFSKCSFTR